jgi:transposase InsO family protein
VSVANHDLIHWLPIWFWAAYLVTTQTPGMSALQFQKQLGIKRYETAFLMLHKLRAAMVRADRGSSMVAKTTAQLCMTLGITKSHNRPHVSNDNPYSERQFKMLKYSPSFPGRFGSLQDSVSFCRPFFDSVPVL